MGDLSLEEKVNLIDGDLSLVEKVLLDLLYELSWGSDFSAEYVAKLVYELTFGKTIERDEE